MVVPLNNSHVNQIISIHIQCFPESQSTKFGASFIKSFYSGHIKATNAVCFVDETEEGKIRGFITGGVNVRFLSRQVVLSSKFGFLINSLINLLKNPLITVKKYLAYARAFLISKPKGKTFYKDNTAGLESIAILPEYRGQGIADKLVKSFLQELKKRGISACRLGVEADNISARKFYEKMGFEKVNEEGTSYIYFFDDIYRNKIGKNS